MRDNLFYRFYKKKKKILTKTNHHELYPFSDPIQYNIKKLKNLIYF